MRKLFILLGIMVTSLTLVACGEGGETKTPPSYSGIRIENTSPIDGTDFVTFYKAKQETVFVEISLNNPSGLEIKSIVINGYTYSSTRFSDNSTSNTIYFDLNVGSVLGENVYSVDKISYLDGENSLVVTGFTSNEFKIYVYKEVPTVERENYALNRDSIIIDFNITDVDGVIAPNTLKALLYSGETLVSTQEISKGLTTVEFTGLLANKHYEVKVVASYNLLDNTGMATNVALYSGTYSTLSNGLPSASVSGVEVSSNEVTFNIDFTDLDDVVVPSGLSVAIYNGDTFIDAINITGSTTGLKFSDLLNDNSYTIKVLSDYDLKDGGGIIEDNVLAIHTFSTLPREIPEPQLLNLNLLENSIEFDIFVIDPDGIIDEASIVANLYIEDVFIDSANINDYHVDFQVNNLFANYEFKIELVADYDLNNGLGVQENQIIFSQIYSTLENAIPSVNILDIDVAQGYVTVQLEVADDNETLIGALEAVLYEGDTAVQSISFDVLTTELIFDYATVAGTSYYIEIFADYNLRDGFGAVYGESLRRIISFTAEAKAPIAEVKNVVTDSSSIDFDVTVIDADGTIVDGTIVVYIYHGDTLVDSFNIANGDNDVNFGGLLSNNEYTIIVEANFNLDDGSGVLTNQLLITHVVSTQVKDVPISEITNPDTTDSVITFDIDVIDPDGVILTGTILAILYHEDVEIETIVLDPGANFGVEFIDLLSNNVYEIIIYADYNLNDGIGDIEDYVIGETTLTTKPKSAPSAEFRYTAATETTITVDIFVEDDFSVITPGTLQAVLMLNDAPAVGVLPIDLSEGLNTDIEFIDLFSNERYYVNVVANYDLNDGEPEIEDEVLVFDSVRTVSLDDVNAYIVNTASTINTITFDVEVQDSSSAITGNLKAVLYLSEVEQDFIVLVVGETLGVTFIGVDSETDYVIQIEADYNMNEESGSITGGILDTVNISTLALSAPTASISNFTPDYNSFTVDIDLDNADATITGNRKAVLYDAAGDPAGQEVVLVDGLNSGVEFTGLLSNNVYEVRVIVDYDLNDEAGEQTNVELTTGNTTTLAKIVPNIKITNLTINKSQVSFDIEIDDVDDVLEADSLYAALWIDDALVTQQQIILNNVTFDISGMIADFEFTIIITGDYDLDDGEDVTYGGTIHEIELTTEANEIPTSAIESVVVNQNSIDVSVDIVDTDNTIYDNLKAYLIDENDLVIDEIDLVLGANEISFLITVDESQLYKILISTDYNLYDGEGVVPSQDLEEYILSVVNKLIPQSEISNLVLTDESITFDVDVFDNHGVITGNTKVELFLGNETVALSSFVLGVGGNPGISFTGLLSNTDYRIEITTDYNNGDGNGTYVRFETITDEKYQTTNENIVPSTVISNLVEDVDSITVDIEVIDDDIVSSSRTVVLYEGTTIIETKILSIGDNDGLVFNTLYSSTNYRFEVIYDYDLNDGGSAVTDEVSVEQLVLTLSKTEPIASLDNGVESQESIIFDVTIDDPNNASITRTADLYKDGVYQSSISLNIGDNIGKTFAGLESNSNYNIKIVVVYNLNENEADVTDTLVQDNFITEAKLAPTSVLDNVVTTEDVITFDASITDADGVSSVRVANLYQDGSLIDTLPLDIGDNDGETFTGLISDLDYVIKIEVTYNLNEGNSDTIETLAETTTHTVLITIPTATIDSYTEDYFEISVDITVVDDDSAINGDLLAVLYENDIATGASEILVVGENTVSFTSLDANNEYEIRVEADYNINDGSGDKVSEQLTNIFITTLAKEIPVVTISNLIITDDEVTFNYVLDDVDSVLSAGTIKASLWVGALKISEKSLFTNEVTFNISGFLADYDFEIRITGDYDLDDGVGPVTAGTIKSLELTTEANAAPTAVIQSLEVNQNTIDLVILVTDDDSTVTNNLIAVLYDKDDVIIETITLYEGSNTIAFAYTVTYQEMYSVVIYSDYDLLDGEGEQTDEELAEYLFSVQNKLIPQAEISNIIIGEETITFDVDIYDNDSVITGNIKAILYKDGVYEAELVLINGPNPGEVFNSLLSNHEYSIVIVTDYNNGNGNGVIAGYSMTSILETTLTKNSATASIVVDSFTDTTIVVDITVTDSSSVTSIRVAKIYDDEHTLIDTKVLGVGDNDTTTFTGLYSDMVYTIEVELTYDMNDDEGIESTVVETLDQATYQNTVPTAIINDTSSTTSEITVDYDFTDDDGIRTNVFARIYLNNVQQAEIALSVGVNQTATFTGLDPNTEYIIKIESTYNLNDEAGVQTSEVLDTETISTESLLVLEGEVITNLRNSVEITFDDYEGLITGTVTANLIENGVTVSTYIISTTTTTVVDMINLLAEYDYTLEIEATYDVGSGNVTEVIYTHEFTTGDVNLPTVEIEAAEDWDNSGGNLTVDVAIGLDDNEYAGDATWTAVLYQDGVSIQTSLTAITEDALTIVVFTGVNHLDGSSYTILIQATVDMNVEPGDVAITTDMGSKTFADAGN